MKLLLLVGMIKMSIGRHGKNVINNVTLKKKGSNHQYGGQSV